MVGTTINLYILFVFSTTTYFQSFNVELCNTFHVKKSSLQIKKTTVMSQGFVFYFKINMDTNIAKRRSKHKEFFVTFLNVV